MSESSASVENTKDSAPKVSRQFVDLLDEDRPIASQKFTCISFISPENILKDKNLYYFKEFIKNREQTKEIERFTQYLNFLSMKYNLKFDDLMDNFKQFLTSQKDKVNDSTIHDDYKNFVDEHEERLQNEFNIANDFQTNVRGIKVRGSFPTMEEAEMRCKMLREVDPYHNVYVGPVGIWMPWEPEAYKTGRVEYLEEELNKLMHEKHKNDGEAKKNFEQRLLESKRKAIDENKKNSVITGNKLTQDVDKKGNLVGTSVSTVENQLNAKNGKVGEGDVRSLFDSDNVITKSGKKKGKKKKKKKKK
tara:strand:- start:993 stop:1907 length:915 start_codon:yes stop_codon:yes gene_type:complete